MALKLNKLSQVALSCSDLKQTIVFYRDVLGVEFVAEFSPPGLACFRLGTVSLLIEGGATGEAASVHPSGALYLAVDDLQAAYTELLARGVRFDSGPHLIHRDNDGIFGRVGAETWMAFFKDPSGNVLALSEQR